MSFRITFLTMTVLATSLLGCNKVSFKPTEALDQKLEAPEFPLDPVPTTTTTTLPPPSPTTTTTTLPPTTTTTTMPPVPTTTTSTTTTTTTTLPPPSYKTGACANQENVASCLKCEVPPLPPTMSTKAQKLAKIMTMACQIPNKSYPANYVPPTASQVEEHLLACSPTLYPETPMTAPQSAAIDLLLNEQDDSLRQKMFKGLWYKPPFSEYYETYFGMASNEAAYVVCMNSGTLGPILATKEYVDAMSGNGNNWSSDPAAQARWNFAQMLRKQLLSCFNKPGTPPPPVNPPDAKVCQYRTFEGEYSKGGLEEINRNLAEGYQMAVETSNACMLLTSTPAPGSLIGHLKIVGYKCP